MTNLETLRGKWRRKVDSRQRIFLLGGSPLPSISSFRRRRKTSPVLARPNSRWGGRSSVAAGGCRAKTCKRWGEQKLNQWFWRDFIPDHLIWDGKIHYSLLQSLSILGWVLFLPNLKIWETQPSKNLRDSWAPTCCLKTMKETDSCLKRWGQGCTQTILHSPKLT